MNIKLENKKGITMVALVVTIILLIILAGVSIHATLGEDGIITIAKKARENMEYAQIEEQTKLNELYTQMEEGIGDGDFSYDILEKINEFKKAIAEYIEQAGGVKPEPPETAPTETFGESILGLSSQDATATPDKIVKDYTAYVKGEKITGTLEIPSLKDQTSNATATADKILKGYTAYVNGELITGTLVMPSLASQTGGTAVAGDILSGKTAWVNGNKVTGTMPNQGAKTATLNAGQSYTIPAGYHNGQGRITANSLANQTGGTATADKILKDYTAYVNGTFIKGTMSNNGAVNKTLNAGQSYTIVAGYHNGSGKVTAASLASQTGGTATADNIEQGKTAWVNGNQITGNQKKVTRYDCPYVPKGFEHTTGEWNNGYTIQQVNPVNAFVWVPCVTNQNQVRQGDSVVTFGRVTSGMYNSNNYTNFIDGDSSAAEIRASVEKYQGFYIAAYEACLNDVTPNSSLGTKKKTDGSFKPRSWKNKGVWNYIENSSGKPLLTVSKVMIDEASTGAKSALISGEAWDTTLQWMVKASDNKNNEPNKGYDENSVGKSWDSNVSKNKLHTTGYYAVNNIYDMSGNVREFTTERTIYNGIDYFIFRGGSYKSNDPAAFRQRGGGSENTTIGFRVVLYKP